MFGDPSFIISKAPPGAKSDKKLMEIPICWKLGGLNVANQSQFAPPSPGQHCWLVDKYSLPSLVFLAREGSTSL
jgi:hypothetical protein